ncbi:unnamed protein product [Leuciscus chuanchicus]
MGPKSDPASRSPALSPLGLWNPLQVASQFQSPLGPNFKSLAQEPFGLQEKQLLQGPVKPLDWRYPTVPEVQSELVENFPMRQPVTPGSVAVQCGENRVLVEVQQDLFSNGQLIQPTGLSLGGCPVVGQDPESRVLIFEYELQDCNSVLMMNEVELVYTFSLTYTPEALAGTPITRSDGAIVGVQCHYQRLQNVSSDALRPTWFPYASTKAGEEVLLFSLKIMMDDWSYQRPSYTYFLGGVINIEASVKQYNHVPLRVFVDRCVATQVPDVNSLPRFSFIENHGCFVDAKTTASSSRFMPRSQVDKLQFQLEAFMFREGNSPSIYITCILKATIASAPSDAQRKSCSFANGWSAADGNDEVCGCCDSTCGPDGEFAASPYGGIQWEGKASLGPVMVQGQKRGKRGGTTLIQRCTNRQSQLLVCVVVFESKFVRMGFLKVVFVMVVIVAFDLPDVWGSLRYSHSPRSIGPKSDPASRSPALSPLGLWNPLQVASQFQSPLVPDFKSLAQEPFGLQEKQLLQGPVKPLDWRYPVVPEVQRELAVDFQLRQPVTPSSVAVQCGENRVLVEVQQDFFSNGQLIQPTGLSLGGCPVVGQDPESRVLIFDYELQNCISLLMMNEDELVYTFSLTYTPEALAGTPITRADGAIVGVQCHYQRLQNVSSDALRPTWFPYASTKAGEEVLLFSLKIMMDDWSYQRPSYSYFLGDVINIEASVYQYNHVPLRVFVDRCVATQVPDVNSLPRYSFIENHGCFVDAKTTASSSRFMPRSQVDKIHFQLEAFMFHEGNSLSIYITCILKATIASAPSDAQRKSCSFANGWIAADGNDQVCGCCDSTCGPDEFAASPYGGW